MQLAEAGEWSVTELCFDCVTRVSFGRAALVEGLVNSGVMHERACLLLSLGMPPRDVWQYLASRDAQPARASVLRGKLVYLLHHLRMPRAKLCRLIMSHMRLLDYSLEHTIKPRVNFFVHYFNVDSAAEVGKAACSNPRLLWAHMELDVEAKITLLNGVTGDPAGVAVMLRRTPALLTFSEVNLQEKLTALVRSLGLTAEELPVVLRRAPSVLTRKASAPRTMFAALAPLLGGPHAARDAILRSPELLTLSPKNVTDKIKFLVNVAGYEPAAIVSNPAVLRLSLRKRLVPRLRYLRARGLRNNPTTAAGGPVLSSAMAMLSQDKFLHSAERLVALAGLPAREDAATEALAAAYDRWALSNNLPPASASQAPQRRSARAADKSGRDAASAPVTPPFSGPRQALLDA